MDGQALFLCLQKKMVNSKEREQIENCCDIQCGVGRGFGLRQTWVQIQATPLTSGVALRITEVF